MGLNVIFFFAAFFAAGWFFGHNRGLKQSTARSVRPTPAMIEEFSDDDLADLGKIMKTIFWTFKLEQQHRRFVVFDAKTSQKLALVSVSKKLSRKSKNTIDGVLVITYPTMPSESDIRSDLSNLLW